MSLEEKATPYTNDRPVPCAAVEDVDDFFSPAAMLLGLYNAESRADDKDAFQEILQEYTEQIWLAGKKVGEEMTRLKNRLQMLGTRAERLHKDVTRITGKLDHRTVRHRWQQVMLLYDKYGRRIRDLLQQTLNLDLGEDGVLYASNYDMDAESFANDVLGNTGNLSLKECLFHIHHIIVGGTLFTNAPLFKTYNDLAHVSTLRHQSVRWHVQVYISHVIAIQLAGMALLTTALNITNRHEEVRGFHDDMKQRLEEQDCLIREISEMSDPTFYPSGNVEAISFTYVEVKSGYIENGGNKNDPHKQITNDIGMSDINSENEADVNKFKETEAEAHKWCPIMGAQLFRKQEGVLSIKFTVMDCPALDSSRQWGPPKVIKVSDDVCEIAKDCRDHVLGQRVTLNWSRVNDPFSECICGVRFVVEPSPTDDEENDEDLDIIEKPAPQIGLECIVFSKNDPSEPKYILPPHFDDVNDFVVTKGGQGKRLNIFTVDVGRAVPKQPGWVTGVRLHLRESIISLGLETSYW